MKHSPPSGQGADPAIPVVPQTLSALAGPILAMPRVAKRAVAVLVDLGLCVLTVWLAFYLRLGEFVPLSGNALWAVGASIGIALPVFTVSGLYRAIFRYSGWPALLAVARAICVYGLLYASIFTAIGVVDVPRTVGLIQPVLLLLFVGASRALARVWLGEQYLHVLQRAARPRVLIYGAGNTGRQLAAAIANSHEMQVVGFLDDDEHLHGQVLNGLPIHSPAGLQHLSATRHIHTVLLAMPGLSRSRRTSILQHMRSARVAVRTLPNVIDLARGRVSVADLRDLDIDDLLGRDPVAPDPALLGRNITGKVVLVTGAGGSIGSELCRQILALAPVRLLLVEQSEFALYAIDQELQEKRARQHQATRGSEAGGATPQLVPLLASVQDGGRMSDIMRTWQPDTVYHAAAYKHVPLVEHNPAAGIRNNVLGTLRTAQAAAEHGVSDFVLISTDKAVRPTNVMGASKRLAEMALQALAARPGDSDVGNDCNLGQSTPGRTRFSMVRFGNVLGSSGSVVPRFRQQIRSGGPITLTHPEVTRYFMTIPEAAQLVIQAGAMAQGGDVFVLDMGQPVKIIDLARHMVELSGLTVQDAHNPAGDIPIVMTGLRPGEKLYEELLIGDNPQPTAHPGIMKAHEDFLPWEEFQARLQTLQAALDSGDMQALRTLMLQLVTGYRPSDGIVDWVHLAQAGHDR